MPADGQPTLATPSSGVPLMHYLHSIVPLLDRVPEIDSVPLPTDTTSITGASARGRGRGRVHCGRYWEAWSTSRLAIPRKSSKCGSPRSVHLDKDNVHAAPCSSAHGHFTFPGTLYNTLQVLRSNNHSHHSHYPGKAIGVRTGLRPCNVDIDLR